MADYIERDALQPTCNQLATTCNDYIKRSYLRKMAMLEMAYTMETETDAAVVLRMIDDAPAADVEPVRHGRWEAVEGREFLGVCCSICNHWVDSKSPYCPNCGARMDGDADD